MIALIGHGKCGPLTVATPEGFGRHQASDHGGESPSSILITPASSFCSHPQ
jgi:hypothetical protein